MTCKICSSPSDFFADAVIINKYKISYYRCSNCGFVQTEDPYWFQEVYSSAINSSDVGLVKRNMVLSDITRMVILFFNKKKKFIDYGGGYGLFVRLMRDKGIDYYWSDSYCENIFAKSFEASDAGKPYELLTAFEVFEHLKNPIEELHKMLAFSKNILFSTILFPSNNPKPNEWWYYGLDHGQHIALYTEKSLKILAESYKLNFYTNGKNIHLITEKKIAPLLFRLASIPWIVQIMTFFFKKTSLTETDYKAHYSK